MPQMLDIINGLRFCSEPTILLTIHHGAIEISTPTGPGSEPSAMDVYTLHEGNTQTDTMETPSDPRIADQPEIESNVRSLRRADYGTDAKTV